MATDNNSSYEKYILPSKYADLSSFSKKFKPEMMKHVLDSIEHAINTDLPIVEVFQFKNSGFVITLSDEDYLTNLENLYTYFLQNEEYENCDRLMRLQKTIKEKSENKPDEKKKR